MKLFWIRTVGTGLIALLALVALSGDYRILDLKPEESQELARLQANVDQAQKNVDAAWTALKNKRSAVCMAHGLSKETCDPNGYYGLAASGTLMTGNVPALTGTGWGGACSGWDAEYKHLVVGK